MSSQRPFDEGPFSRLFAWARKIEYQSGIGLCTSDLCYTRKLQRIGRKAEAQAYFAKAAENGNGDVKAAAEKEMR